MAADLATKKSTFVDTDPSEDDSQGSVCAPSTLSSPKTESSKLSTEKKSPRVKKYEGIEKNAHSKYVADSTPAAKPSFTFSASIPRDPRTTPFVQHVQRDPVTNRLPRTVANQWSGVRVYKNESRENSQRIERNARGIKATPEDDPGVLSKSHKKIAPKQSPGTMDSTADMESPWASASTTNNTPKIPSVKEIAQKLVAMENAPPSTPSKTSKITNTNQPTTPNAFVTDKSSMMRTTTPIPTPNASASNPDTMAANASARITNRPGHTTTRTPELNTLATKGHTTFVVSPPSTVTQNRINSVIKLAGYSLGALKSHHDVTQAKLQLITNLASAAATDDPEGVRLSDYLELFQEIANFAATAAHEVAAQVPEVVNAFKHELGEVNGEMLDEGIKEGYVDRKAVLEGLGVADDWECAVELTGNWVDNGEVERANGSVAIKEEEIDGM